MGKRGTIRGHIGQSIDLQASFYKNGVLFDPFAISSVKIYSVSTGGSSIATLSTPTKVSTGVYKTSWTIPSNQTPGTYYDEWIWQAVQTPTTTKTQRYSFEVSRPSTVPVRDITRPLFVGPREVSFFHGINKELLQKIVQQKIIYYSVSLEHSNVHRLYGESTTKTVFTPVEVNALVLYKEPEQTVGKYSIDVVYSIEVYFYQEELRERKILPRVGDFIKFGSVVYELHKITEPQITFGQIDKEVMVKATAQVARESQIKILDDIQGVNK